MTYIVVYKYKEKQYKTITTNNAHPSLDIFLVCVAEAIIASMHENFLQDVQLVKCIKLYVIDAEGEKLFAELDPKLVFHLI